MEHTNGLVDVGDKSCFHFGLAPRLSLVNLSKISFALPDYIHKPKRHWR